MVTPFLTLQQLSVLFARPSAVLDQDAKVPLSAVEKFLQSEDEEQGRAIAMLATDFPQSFKDVA